MAFTHNLKLGIDLPIWQWLRFLPATTAVGACQISDRRGTDRYIYMLFSVTSFWRYDTITDSYQQLASPNALGGSGTWGAGTCMTFAPCQGTAGYIYLFNAYSTQNGFGYYDIAANTWTSRSTTSLPATWGTDGMMSHVCTTYNAEAASNDFIYLIGNNSTTWYRYSISGNSWVASPTTIANLPAAAGAGCGIHWISGQSTDTLVYIRATTTTALYKYTISSNTWSADVAYLPKTETFTTGTQTVYESTNNRIWLQKDSTHRLYYYDVATDRIYPSGSIPYLSGTAIVGDGLAYIKTTDGAQFIYYRRQTGNELWRMLIFS